MQITEKTLNTWLYECGWTCPRCGLAIGVDDRIEAPTVMDDSVYIDYRCSRCALEWANAYRLSNPVILNDEVLDEDGGDEDRLLDWFERNGIPGMRWEGEDGSNR